MSIAVLEPPRQVQKTISSPPLLERPGPALGLLLALCSFLFLYGIWQGDLYRTEGLRALLGEEFLRTGNWIVPTLYGEPLLTKPPGIYAAIAVASVPAGHVTTITARLPSVLAATLTVLLFYATFARVFGRRAGLAAAAILPASVMWLERVPTAEIDLLQLAWVAAALLALPRAIEEAETDTRGGWREWFWWQLALLAVAAGVLTKWTAPAFFYLSAVPLLWWRGQLRVLFRWPHLLAAALAALPCFLWAGAAIQLAGWESFRDTVGREALQRLSPAHHPRAYPWRELVLFPLEFLLTNLPWSAIALLALRPSFGQLWDRRGRLLWQLFHSWTWANLLFWTLVPGHRPRHGMPLQPGLAGLAALVWIAWLTGRLPWRLPRAASAGRILVGLLGLWLVVKLGHAHYVVPTRDRDRHTHETGQRLARLVPEGEMLYLGSLKDEGVLFYYARPARRLSEVSGNSLPAEANYLVLTGEEWEHWSERSSAQVIDSLHDEQGAPIVLVHRLPPRIQ
jgi:4-amino-4-deoxy-L-arabinose transferase-like glycosyltransferase